MLFSLVGEGVWNYTFFSGQPLSMVASVAGFDGLSVMLVTTFSSLQRLLYAELWRGKISCWLWIVFLKLGRFMVYALSSNLQRNAW
jgi:hypothetical protein